MTVPYILTLITFVPLVGAILVALIPKENVKAIKWTALAVSLIPLVLSVILWLSYSPTKPGGMAFEEIYEWIPALGVRYHVGADGLSIPLIFLTALLTTLSILYSFIINASSLPWTTSSSTFSGKSAWCRCTFSSASGAGLAASMRPSSSSSIPWPAVS